MAQHYPRSTVSAAAWCKKCEKQTQHRVDDRRLGPCMECMAALDQQHVKPKIEAPRQGALFMDST